MTSRWAWTAGIGVLVLLVACGRSGEQPPVSWNRLTEVLVELHLAHARAELSEADSVAYVDPVYARHTLTEGDFRAAMQYYARRPEAYVALMDSVVDRLRLMRPSVTATADDPVYARPYGSVFRDTVQGGVE